ncbi:hypothetical protein AUP68_07935 [Ilyonectria robusta]
MDTAILDPQNLERGGVAADETSQLLRINVAAAELDVTQAHEPQVVGNSGYSGHSVCLENKLLQPRHAGENEAEVPSFDHIVALPGHALVIDREV